MDSGHGFECEVEERPMRVEPFDVGQSTFRMEIAVAGRRLLEADGQGEVPGLEVAAPVEGEPRVADGVLDLVLLAPDLTRDMVEREQNMESVVQFQGDSHLQLVIQGGCPKSVVLP